MVIFLGKALRWYILIGIIRDFGKEVAVDKERLFVNGRIQHTIADYLERESYVTNRGDSLSTFMA